MKINYNWNELSPREYILAHDHTVLHELCAHSELIDYQIQSYWKLSFPVSYLLIYRVKSIVDIEPISEAPISGDCHKVLIETAVSQNSGYPDQAARSYLLSPIWHPNIDQTPVDGRYRICGGDMALQFGIDLDLAQLALHIGEMLQFKVYHAANQAPYPQSPRVAKWIREKAEPLGWVNKAKNIPWDRRPLQCLTKELFAKMDHQSFPADDDIWLQL